MADPFGVGHRLQVEACTDEPSSAQEREDAAMLKSQWEYKSIQSILDMDQFQVRDYIVESRRSEDAMTGVILNVIRDLAQCEEDLLSQAARIERDLTTMRENLEAGHHLNGSGVLQRGPIELDMLAQRRMLLIESLKRLLYVTKKMGAKA